MAASAKTVSTSEQSYGSILNQAKDVLEVIKQVPGYSPSNPHIQTLNFETFLNDIDTKNTLVAQRYEEYDNAVEDRKSKYDKLAERVTKVKLALAAQYGKDSNEYRDSVKY